MAGEFVNLNEAGALTRSGQGYDGTADDHAGEARTFSGRMDASHQGLRGAAGAAFRGVADGHSANVAALARHIAEQAVRAVRGDATIVDTDTNAHSAQAASVTAVDTQTTALSRPITY
jgi:hypothetical protein